MRVKDHPKTYQQRCDTFDPEQNPTCPNYLKAIEFAKANGYIMSKDISYNGYIFFEKVICDGEYKLEFQVYDDIIKTSEPDFQPYWKEMDFSGNLYHDAMYGNKARFKMRNRTGGYNTPNLDELFKLALEIEKEYIAEDKEVRKKYPRQDNETFGPLSPTVERKFESKVPGVHYVSKNLLDSHFILAIHKKSDFPISLIMLKLSESVLAAIDVIDEHLKQCDWTLDIGECKDIHKENAQSVRNLFSYDETKCIHTLKK